MTPTCFQSRFRLSVFLASSSVRTRLFSVPQPELKTEKLHHRGGLASLSCHLQDKTSPSCASVILLYVSAIFGSICGFGLEAERSVVCCPVKTLRRSTGRQISCQCV